MDYENNHGPPPSAILILCDGLCSSSIKKRYLLPIPLNPVAFSIALAKKNDERQVQVQAQEALHVSAVSWNPAQLPCEKMWHGFLEDERHVGQK